MALKWSPPTGSTNQLLPPTIYPLAGPSYAWNDQISVGSANTSPKPLTPSQTSRAPDTENLMRTVPSPTASSPSMIHNAPTATLHQRAKSMRQTVPSWTIPPKRFDTTAPDDDHGTQVPPQVPPVQPGTSRSPASSANNDFLCSPNASAVATPSDISYGALPLEHQLVTSPARDPSPQTSTPITTHQRPDSECLPSTHNFNESESPHDTPSLKLPFLILCRIWILLHFQILLLAKLHYQHMILPLYSLPRTLQSPRKPTC